MAIVNLLLLYLIITSFLCPINANKTSFMFITLGFLFESITFMLRFILTSKSDNLNNLAINL